MEGRAFQLCNFIGQQLSGILISKMSDRYYQMIASSYQEIDKSYQVQSQNLNWSSLPDKTNPLQILRCDLF